MNVQALKHQQHEWRRPTVEHPTYAPLVSTVHSLWWVVFYAFHSANAIFSWSPMMSCGFQAYELYCSCYLCPLMSGAVGVV